MRARARPWPWRLLVLALSDRCDQRCVHCSIWKGARGASLPPAERLRIVDEALAAGVREALLTGGEPLLAPDLWPVAARLRAGGARLMLATNGMQLERHAQAVGRWFAEVFVSMDGAVPSTHDGLRGAPAFARLAAGLRALRTAAPALRQTIRCTLHAGNLGELEPMVEAARRLGCDHVSFLALDASSPAFGADVAGRARLVPTVAQVEGFRAAVRRLATAGRLDDGFVREPAAKLLRLADHLDATAGRGAHARPACGAPWWSLVVEADGTVRPCFFQEAVGHAREGLRSLREGGAYRAALDAIAAPNPTCARCVCPKARGQGLLSRLVS